MSSHPARDQAPETRQLESSDSVEATSPIDAAPESTPAVDDGYDLYDNMPCTD